MIHRFVTGVCIFVVCANYFIVALTDHTDEDNNDLVTLDTFSSNSDELLRRRVIANRFLATFSEAQNDYIETYDSTFKDSELTNSFNANDETNSVEGDVINTPSTAKETEVPPEESPHPSNIPPSTAKKTEVPPEESPHPSNIPEKLYLIRWLNRLTKILEIDKHENSSICFPFNSELVAILKEVASTHDFDIVSADELISNLISNATFHYGKDWSSALPSVDNFIFYIAIIGASAFFTYCFYCFAKKCSLIVFVTVTFVIVPFIASVAWHARKMYKVRLAEKHATLSRIPSSKCVSMLTSDSGIADHIHEYVRRYFYDEDCKKYYQAVMVDPSDEISIPIAMVDLVFTSIFQIFITLGTAINSFVKVLIYDMTFISHIYIILLFIFLFFILLLCFNYRIKLPFFLGCVEPAVSPVGSQTEDLKLHKNPNLHLRSNENCRSIKHISKVNEVQLLSHQPEICNTEDNTCCTCLNIYRNKKCMCYNTHQGMNKIELLDFEDRQKEKCSVVDSENPENVHLPPYEKCDYCSDHTQSNSDKKDFESANCSCNKASNFCSDERPVCKCIQSDQSVIKDESNET